MVQILPQVTSVSNEVGQGLREGMQQGQSLYAQLLPFLIQRDINQNIYGGGQVPTGNGLAPGLNGSVGSGPIPQANSATAPQFPQPTSMQQPTAPSPAAVSSPNQSIFSRRTPQEIEALASRAARLGGDFGQVQQQFANQNRLAEANVAELERLAKEEGFGAGRVAELMDYAATRPDLKTPQAVLGAAKKEFGQIEKANVPGFWTALTQGPEARAQALKNQTAVAQALKRAGREQEGRSTYAENGLSQTEINYLFNPPSAQTEKAIKELPDGSLPKETFKRYFPEQQRSGAVRPFQNDYERNLEKHPKIVEKQNERLEQFFRDNVTPSTSLLVLRDQLWNKGYDWRQIAQAFDRAFPDANRLNTDQFSELTELHQAPLPSLSDLFSAGFLQRLSAVTQGKK